MAQEHHHHEPQLATADSVRRNIVRRSSLENANQDYYPSLTNQSTVKDGSDSPSSGRPYPYFVPSTVKSTLGSPVRFLLLYLQLG